MGVEVVGGVLPSPVSLPCTPAAGRVMLEPSLIRPPSLKNIQWLPLSAGPKHSLKDGIPGPPQTALPAAPVPQEWMERWSLFSQLLFLCLFINVLFVNQPRSCLVHRDFLHLLTRGPVLRTQPLSHCVSSLQVGHFSLSFLSYQLAHSSTHLCVIHSTLNEHLLYTQR